MHKVLLLIIGIILYSVPSHADINITVIQLSKNKFWNLTVQDDTTIADIKNIIHEQGGDLSSDKILFVGSILKDTTSIGDLGIDEGETIYTMPKTNIPISPPLQKATIIQPVTENHRVIIFGAAGPGMYKPQALKQIYRVNINAFPSEPDLLGDITKPDHMESLPSQHFDKVQSEYLPFDVLTNEEFLKTVHRVLNDDGIYEVNNLEGGSDTHIRDQEKFYQSHGFSLQRIAPCQWYLGISRLDECVILKKIIK